jgi:hypothetical protein
MVDDAPTPTWLLFSSHKDAQKPVDLRTAWETVIKLANFTDFHSNDLSRCTASYLAMNGASLAV